MQRPVGIHKLHRGLNTEVWISRETCVRNHAIVEWPIKTKSIVKWGTSRNWVKFGSRWLLCIGLWGPFCYVCRHNADWKQAESCKYHLQSWEHVARRREQKEHIAHFPQWWIRCKKRENLIGPNVRMAQNRIRERKKTDDRRKEGSTVVVREGTEDGFKASNKDFYCLSSCRGVIRSLEQKSSASVGNVVQQAATNWSIGFRHHWSPTGTTSLRTWSLPVCLLIFESLSKTYF